VSPSLGVCPRCGLYGVAGIALETSEGNAKVISEKIVQAEGDVFGQNSGSRLSIAKPTT
jgi:hypothetical protein